MTSATPPYWLAISSDANMKAVQRMLGHSSAAMTLDTHADLSTTIWMSWPA
jgi:integrase